MQTLEQIGEAQLKGFITDEQAKRYAKALPLVTSRLYMDLQGGRIACFAHLGMYGQADVLHAPHAPMWITPLDVLAVVTAAMIAEMEADGDYKVECEGCRHG